VRTYVYKLTSDRGGAPCAPPPQPGKPELLTLSICKPAIRRTAQPGDRILGITSRSLHENEGYPLHAVIYAARVTQGMDARDYYAYRGPFRSRPDCIYAFHRANGTLTHTGRTPLHDDPAYEARDIGRYPFYRNARTLLAEEFRYFGSEAVVIPQYLTCLRHLSNTLGQGHRVFYHGGSSQVAKPAVAEPEVAELDRLFSLLWKLPTKYTPIRVDDESYGHAPRPCPPSVRSRVGRGGLGYGRLSKRPQALP
jgi:hypothetical protein